MSNRPEIELTEPLFDINVSTTCLTSEIEAWDPTISGSIDLAASGVQTFTITTNPLVDVIPGCYDYFVTADGKKVNHFSVATDGDESVLTVTYTPTNNDVSDDFDQVGTKSYKIRAELKTIEDNI